MRNDGSFTFYEIQHQQKSDGKWEFSSLDYFGHPEGFSASHECWQKTGVTATFDPLVAEDGLDWISKRNPKEKFRLVMRHVTQTTVVFKQAGSGGRA